MLRNTAKGMMAIVLCGGVLVAGGAPAGTLAAGNNAVYAASLADTSNLIYLSESELEEIGLTNAFSSALLKNPVNESRTQLRALPIWAAAAIVGCTGSLALGEGKDQVKNAFKEGRMENPLIPTGFEFIFSLILIFHSILFFAALYVIGVNKIWDIKRKFTLLFLSLIVPILGPAVSIYLASPKLNRMHIK
ncbi:MAG: hypothetical protein Q4C74_05195 [Rothia sp. (in: high G+C Gram-positive bacteria)]|nr:hypothetical protein [Rothia sp. (in: high G+C Gram-positive bacteria)]